MPEMEVTARVSMTNLPPECLVAYRLLRKAGVGRRDANMMVAGMAMGMDGDFEIGVEPVTDKEA